jgi:hypothetical protein
MPKPDRKPDPDLEPEYDVADLEQEDGMQASYDEVTDPDYEVEADPEYDDTVQVDYELAADPDYDEVVVEYVVEEAIVVAPIVAAGFAFELGRPVLPLTQVEPHPVVWRGHLKERHPATGLVQRVPVYRLADGYWDCYREEELQAA